jgi:hypothetical protein
MRFASGGALRLEITSAPHWKKGLKLLDEIFLESGIFNIVDQMPVNIVAEIKG